MAALGLHPVAGDLLILAFLIAVYYDGLWGAPRADQVIYLYEAAQFQTITEVFIRSPSWNRTVSVGDHALYRPIFYVFLAAQHALFGLNSFLWQAVGVTLHAVQCVLLHRLLRYSRPHTPVVNLLLVGLFASCLISAEAVIWQHINAYLLFSVCATLSLMHVLRYLDSGNRANANWATLFAVIAAFTYEGGAISCAITAGSLLRPSRRAPLASAIGPSRHADLPSRTGLGLAFCGVIGLYVALDVGDFLARFGRIENSDVRLPPLGSVGAGAFYVGYQIVVWLGGALVPSLYDLVPSYRTLFLGFKWPPPVESVPNLIGALALLVGGARLVSETPHAIVRKWLRGLVGPALFVLAYAGLVAFGRTVPRGTGYTLQTNLHHSYFVILSAFIAISLAAWHARPAPETVLRPRPAAPVAPAWTWLAIGGLGLILAVNATGTRQLVKAYRHFYSAPKLELLYQARRWHEANPDTYFVVSRDCPGNEILTEGMPWFTVYAHHVAETFRYLDALYPESSLNLNRERAAAGARVGDLSCTQGSIRAGDVLGSWRAGRGKGHILVTQDGQFRIVAEDGAESPLLTNERRVLATVWQVAGVLSHDNAYIFWANGAVWRR